MKMKKPPETGRKGVYASARTGKPNGPQPYSVKTKMLGVTLTSGTIPAKEDIGAAISSLYAVSPTCMETAALQREHLGVIITALTALKDNGTEIDSEDLALPLEYQQKPEDREVREKFYRRMKQLFDF